MKLIRSRKDPTKFLLIAMSDDDMETIQFLYDESICFGFYCLATIRKDNQHYPDIKRLVTAFPGLKGCGYFSSPKGYVPRS